MHVRAACTEATLSTQSLVCIWLSEGGARRLRARRRPPKFGDGDPPTPFACSVKGKVGLGVLWWLCSECVDVHE